MLRRAFTEAPPLGSVLRHQGTYGGGAIKAAIFLVCDQRRRPDPLPDRPCVIIISIMSIISILSIISIEKY